jgi:aryl-alcohol dehydrogenase-like predicted oxidoreductase
VELARVFAEGEHCTAIQHDLNVVLDAPEMLTLCEEQDLASVNRSPLARGALTGKYNKDTSFAGNDVRSDSYTAEHFFGPSLDRLEALQGILTSGGRAGAGCVSLGFDPRPKLSDPGIRTVRQVERILLRCNLAC